MKPDDFPASRDDPYFRPITDRRLRIRWGLIYLAAKVIGGVGLPALGVVLVALDGDMGSPAGLLVALVVLSLIGIVGGPLVVAIVQFIVLPLIRWGGRIVDSIAPK